MDRSQLESRLISFTIDVFQSTKSFKKSFFIDTITKQLIRASVSVSLNYGEAQFAQSRKDFIHKLSLVLKELKECLVCIKLIELSGEMSSPKQLRKLFDENEELVKIFSKTKSTLISNIQ